MALKLRYFDMKPSAPILYEIDAEFIQSLVEPNLGRRLTDIELERMHYALIDNDEAFHELVTFILSAAEDAMDNTGNCWDWIDKDFVDRKTFYTLNGYPIGM